jgi:hypothetical protein
MNHFGFKIAVSCLLAGIIFQLVMMNMYLSSIANDLTKIEVHLALH